MPHVKFPIVDEVVVPAVQTLASLDASIAQAMAEMRLWNYVCAMVIYVVLVSLILIGVCAL